MGPRHSQVSVTGYDCPNFSLSDAKHDRQGGLPGRGDFSRPLDRPRSTGPYPSAGDLPHASVSLHYATLKKSVFTEGDLYYDQRHSRLQCHAQEAHR